MTETLRTRPVLGVGLVAVSMTLIGYIDNYIKVIAAEAGLWQFHFTRGVLICLMLVVLSAVTGWRIWPRDWRAVGLRSLFFSTSMVLYFGAAGMIPIAQAGAGLFTSPIFVLVISAGFLGVRIGIWRVLAVALGFSGVLLILKPGGDGISIAAALPVVAGLFYALSGIATRRWCGAETTWALLLGVFGALTLWGLVGLIWFTLFPAPPDWATAAPFFTSGWVRPSETFLFWVGVQAVGSLIAVAMLTRGYQLVDVTFAAVGEYWFLIAAGFWGWVLWRDLPDGQAVLGAAAIVAAGVIIVLRSRGSTSG
jgi:drug/metabolite transporter (DMT)-like permease